MWEYICSRCGYRVDQEDIITIACPGCGGRSWLTHKLAEDSQDYSPDATESKSSLVTKINRGKHRLGRPQLDLPMDKILQMQAQGKASRDIAKQLGVSHMTVCRALKKAGQEKNSDS